MESFTAFIPINRCPLTCPWTPPVSSLYSLPSSSLRRFYFLYLSVSSNKPIFFIWNENPRPVWWFVILAWIIMVWSDDKSYCLVSSYIEHCLNYHSERVGLRLISDQARQLLGIEHRGQNLQESGFKKISCARFWRFQRGHLPHFWTRYQESENLSSHAADIITHTH